MFHAFTFLKGGRFYSSLTVKSLYEQVHHTSHDPISINGWIKSIRLLKRIAFLDLQDGTSVNPLRIVIPLTNTDEVQFLKILKTGQTLSISNATWQSTLIENNLLNCKSKILSSQLNLWVPFQKTIHYKRNIKPYVI